MKLSKYLLAFAAVVGIGGFADAQAPGGAPGVQIPAEFPNSQAKLVEALTRLMGIASTEGEQRIIGILVGYRTGDIDAAEAVIRLDAVAANELWLAEIVARVRVVEALKGPDLVGVNEARPRVDVIVEILAGEDEVRALLFSEADVEAVLTSFDDGDIGVTEALDRLSRFGGTEPFPFAASDDEIRAVDAEAVVDALAGNDVGGESQISREDVEAAIKTTELRN